MPWFASAYSTSVSSFAGYAAFFGFFKAAVEIISRSRKLTLAAIILWLSALSLSVGNLHYLVSLRDLCGLGEIWSGFDTLPEEAVALNQTYQYRHLGRCLNYQTIYPTKEEVDITVAVLRFRFLLLSFSGAYLMIVAAYRSTKDRTLPLPEYFRGVPILVLFVTGLVSLILPFLFYGQAIDHTIFLSR